MSHRHFCDYAGHYWECEGGTLGLLAGEFSPTVCMCLKHSVSTDDGDHSECPIELLACPEHRCEQLRRISELKADTDMRSFLFVVQPPSEDFVESSSMVRERRVRERVHYRTVNQTDCSSLPLEDLRLCE